MVIYYIFDNNTFPSTEKGTAMICYISCFVAGLIVGAAILGLVLGAKLKLSKSLIVRLIYISSHLSFFLEERASSIQPSLHKEVHSRLNAMGDARRRSDPWCSLGDLAQNSEVIVCEAQLLWSIIRREITG